MQCNHAEKSDPLKSSESGPALAGPPVKPFNPNQGLGSYTLHPANLKGQPDIFIAYIVRLCNCTSRLKVRLFSNMWDSPLIDALDLVVTYDNRAVIEPTVRELQEGTILHEVGVTEASRKIPKRQLNTIGEVNSQSVHENAPDRIKRLKVVAEPATTLQKIKEFLASQRAANAVARKDDVKEYAYYRLRKLHAGEEPKKLTTKELEAVLIMEIRVVITKLLTHKQSWIDLFLIAKSSYTGWTIPGRPGGRTGGAGGT